MTRARYSRCALYLRTMVAAGIACACNADALALSPAGAAAPPPAQTASALLAKIKLLGHPVARLTVGTQVRVQGMAMNADSKQHDAFLSATLFNGQGGVVGHAMGKAEDLKPGRKVAYTLTGSVTAASWAMVRVKVTRVTENVGGAGTD